MIKNKKLKLVGDNIRQIMNEKNISAAELANSSGIAPGNISKILNGNTSMQFQTALLIAQTLKVSIVRFAEGIETWDISSTTSNDHPEALNIGILSINNRRVACIKNTASEIIGTSQLPGILDLDDSSSKLLELIRESIFTATQIDEKVLKSSNINLVMQSYEFLDTRYKFINFCSKYFKNVLILPDWQLTYLSSFEYNEGISLIVDKGVSLSYMKANKLQKIGGWKYPVYDLGGERWLGAEAIHHTIESIEGYTEKTMLASDILTNFGGSITNITETYFKGQKHSDLFYEAAQILLTAYLRNDKEAIKIINHGFSHILRAIKTIDKITQKQLNIAVHGSIADIYSNLLPKNRLIESANTEQKTEFLAAISKESLKDNDIIMN